MTQIRKLSGSNDVIWGVLLSLGSAYLLTLAHESQEVTLFASGDNMVWPRYLLWLLFGLSVLLLVKGLRQVKSPRHSAGHYRRFIGPFLLTLVTLVCFSLISVLGFLPFTFIFSASAAMVMERLKLMSLAIFSVSVTVVVWLVFAKLLSLSLPRGIGVFRELSLVLY